MSDMVRVTDPAEIRAVVTGKIDGDVYTDREVWADADELEQWRVANNQPQQETNNGA